MLIATVNVSIPAGGDGPVASVVNLVGAKTVVLTGFFQGTYVLLASHDNATFVPVLTFDSNGLEEIRQTLSEAYTSVRVRTVASTVPTTVVTLSVSGLSVPGANLFAVLASLPPGASGPQPVFDTAIPFPPTGLESDINVICAGSLLGTIVVEGSANGVDFNQIGSFQAGPQKRTLLGLTQSLEFSPLPTADKVRYVRINVQGQILGTTVVTIGGSVGVGVAPPSSTTLAQAYANGAVVLDQMLILNDARGGGVVVDGSGAGFTGTNAFDVKSAAAGEVAFPRTGGVSVASAISRASGPGVKWSEADFLASSLSLTGAPSAIAALTMVSIGHGTIQGIGNTISDAYDLFIDTAPAGSATITRAFSIGAADAIQAQKGLVLGAGLNPPGESDLVVGPSATIVSQASTGRIGYLAGGTQKLMASLNGGAYVPLLTGPAAGGFTLGSIPFGGATGTLIQDNANLFWDDTNNRLGVDVAAAPTARIHVAGVTVAAGTASIKINPGTLLAVTESGAVENDGVDLWWTDALGVRDRLNNTAAATPTLATVYAAGVNPGDQTLTLVDPKGGITIDASGVLFTFPVALGIANPAAGSVVFPRVGGIAIVSSLSVVSALGAMWDEIDFSATSAIALTGVPGAVTALARMHVGQGSINGAGNTVTDAYDLLVDAAPAGTATLTRSWSAGFAGSVQAKAGLVLGGSSLPPTESDLVVEAGATVVSQANTGRLGYLAGGTQQFVVSMNGGAYVPLLVGPAPGGFTPGSVPFGGATGALTQDNTMLFWDDAGNLLGIGTNGPSARLTVAGGSYTDAAGTRDNTLLTATFAPAGGTAAFNQLDLQYTVDQTGGANGRVTGILISATETAIGGLHYPLDVFAGAGGVTEIFRLTNAGTLQSKQGITLGLGLTGPGESDLAMEAGATNVSQANTGRLGYIAGASQQFYVSLNAGAYVPLLTGPAAGGFTLGSVAFGGATGQLGQDNANFFWDTTPSTLRLDGAGALPTSALRVLTTKTLATPAAGSLWDGVTIEASTLTATMGAGGVTVTALKTNNFYGSTIKTGSGAGALTVSDAYTMFVGAAPIAGVGTGVTTITRAWSFGTTGTAQFGGNISIPDGAVGTPAINFNTDRTCGLYHTGSGATGTILASINGVQILSADATNFSYFSSAGGSGIVISNSSSPVLSLIDRTALTSIRNWGLVTSFTKQGDFTISQSTASGGSIFGVSRFVLNPIALTAAAAATWNGVSCEPVTLIVNGATTPITSLTYFNIAVPTISATSAVVTTDFFTCRIGIATFVGAGPASATRNWSLGIDGNTKFVGGQNVGFTDVNVAGPYAVLATDYALEVRRTTTAAITLNLPSIATVGGGHIVISVDSGYNAVVNNITLAPNGGDKINNVAGNYIQNVTGSSIWLKANATTSNWEII